VCRGVAPRAVPSTDAILSSLFGGATPWYRPIDMFVVCLKLLKTFRKVRCDRDWEAEVKKRLW